MAAEPIIEPLRLCIQASVPISTAAEAEIVYDSLKKFLLAISPDITLNGQVMKALEPCCKKKPKGNSHE